LKADLTFAILLAVPLCHVFGKMDYEELSVLMWLAGCVLMLAALAGNACSLEQKQKQKQKTKAT